MTRFNVVTAELRPALDVLTHLDWPVSCDRVPAIVRALGWTLQTSGVGETSLPTSRRTLMIGQLGDEISTVTSRVSDVLPPGAGLISSNSGLQDDVTEALARAGVDPASDLARCITMDVRLLPG